MKEGQSDLKKIKSLYEMREHQHKCKISNNKLNIPKWNKETAILQLLGKHIMPLMSQSDKTDD